jgi:SpoVK/Ycf46/Vps4 family AAA+-type ATPase
LTELDGVKRQERTVFLLAATNRPEHVDPAVLSRFTEKIEIPNPDLGQRRELFEIMLRKKRVNFEVTEMARELAERFGEISGRDIGSLVDLAGRHALARALKANRPDNVILIREDLMGLLATEDAPAAPAP